MSRFNLLFNYYSLIVYTWSISNFNGVKIQFYFTPLKIDNIEKYLRVGYQRGQNLMLHLQYTLID